MDTLKELGFKTELDEIVSDWKEGKKIDKIKLLQLLDRNVDLNTEGASAMFAAILRREAGTKNGRPTNRWNSTYFHQYIVGEYYFKTLYGDFIPENFWDGGVTKKLPFPNVSGRQHNGETRKNTAKHKTMEHFKIFDDKTFKLIFMSSAFKNAVDFQLKIHFNKPKDKQKKSKK